MSSLPTILRRSPLHPHRIRIPIFRIFYSTTFTVLTLLLIAALLITPGDHIYQSFRASQIYHIFIVGGFYLLTLIVAVLLYGGRLYATRSALAGIPRELNLGSEKGRVARLVEKGLRRSAWVAYGSRPRDLSGEKEREVKAAEGLAEPEKQSAGMESKSVTPAWGTISHPGWSSPSSPDLSNLHYEPVILELPHLLEAKAVSLSPPDPSYDPLPPPDDEPEQPPISDPLVVSLLERPASMGLREYIAHLTNLNMFPTPELGTEFLAIYEQARFSSEELNEIEFRGLMSVFADLLRSLAPPDPGIVETLRAEEVDAEAEAEAEYGADQGDAVRDGRNDDGDGHSIITTATVEHTPRPENLAYASSSPSSHSTPSNASHDGTIHTAPSRPAATSNGTNVSKSTKGSTRRGIRTPSIPSLRPMGSRNSFSSSVLSVRSAAGSVIRLKEARTELDLPFEFVGEGVGGAEG